MGKIHFALSLSALGQSDKQARHKSEPAIPQDTQFIGKTVFNMLFRIVLKKFIML